MSDPATLIGTALAALRVVMELARTRRIRGARLALLGRGPLEARITPSQPYSPSAELWFLVPDNRVPTPIVPKNDIPAVGKAAWFVVPTTFVIHPENLLHIDATAIRITDLILRPLSRSGLPELSDYALFMDGSPRAGGRGSEAALSVSVRAGTNVVLPLFTRLRLDHPDWTVPDPEIRSGDQYEIAISVTPDQPGLFEYELEVRCTDGHATWAQRLRPSMRLARLGPADFERFGRYIHTFIGEQLVSDRADLGKVERDLVASRIQMTSALQQGHDIPTDRAFVVGGHVQAESFTRKWAQMPSRPSQ